MGASFALTAGLGDFIKKSVLEGFTTVNLGNLVIGMIAALLISVFILFIYKASFRGVVYNHSFGISLVVLSAISCLIICTISSNLVLSLGLIGALSLVRFRTAVKDPLDIVYLFWSISTGIACGAQRISFALVGGLFIGILLVVLNMVNMSSNTYLLVIRYERGADLDLKRRLSRFQYSIKSKTATKHRVEMTVQVKMKENNPSFVEDIAMLPGVMDAILVSYNGDYAE